LSTIGFSQGQAAFSNWNLMPLRAERLRRKNTASS
jgi:hypothetical protein